MPKTAKGNKPMKNVRIFSLLATVIVTSQAHADLVYDAEPVVIQQQAAPVVQHQPAVQEPTLSRSELIRRERIRKEMQAEDVLSARMETLRLRDEERRVNSLIQQDTQGAVAPAQQVVVTTQSAPVAAVTASPEQVSVLPVSAVLDAANEDDFRVAITPRGGVANLAVQNNYNFTVNPFYAFGGHGFCGISESLQGCSGFIDLILMQWVVLMRKCSQSRT